MILLGAAAVGVLLFAIIAKRCTSQEMTVLNIRARDSDLAGYLVGYLLPFLSMAASTWRDVLALALFFIVIGVVYVNSRMIYVNPVLAIMGYHLYEVQATTDPKQRDPSYITPQFLVSKRTWIRQGDPLTVRRIMADALIELAADSKDTANGPKRKE